MADRVQSKQLNMHQVHACKTLKQLQEQKQCNPCYRHCHVLTVPAASPAAIMPPGSAARARASLIADSCPRSSKSGRPCMRIMFSCECDVRTTADCLESKVPHMARMPPYSSFCSEHTSIRIMPHAETQRHDSAATPGNS